MKLCMIVPYYSPSKGGITSYVSNLASTVHDKGVSVTVITREGENGNNIHLITSNKALFIIRSGLMIFKLKPDVIHSHDHWYTLAPAILYKFFNLKTGVVHTFHTDPMKEMKGLKRKIFEWLLSNCNVVTCVSIFLMKKIEGNLKITTKIKVIYAGATGNNNFDVNEINKFKEGYNLNDSAPILSFVGGLVWEKKVEGVKKLVEAFKDVTKEYPNAKLLIIGGGKYREDVERLVKELGIENNVILTGFLDDVFVPLSITDIYTHISLQEGGVSISLLEAMSMGKPVIATRVGGIPELITDGENGILVDSEPKAIAKAILELFSDEEERIRLGENAKKTVETRYNWSEIAEEFIKIYGEK